MLPFPRWQRYSTPMCTGSGSGKGRSALRQPWDCSNRLSGSSWLSFRIILPSALARRGSIKVKELTSKMHASLADRFWYGIIVTVLVITGLLSLFPIYYVFVISFIDPSEYLKGGLILFPRQWTLDGYK